MVFERLSGEEKILRLQKSLRWQKAKDEAVRAGALAAATAHAAASARAGTGLLKYTPAPARVSALSYWGPGGASVAPWRRASL